MLAFFFIVLSSALFFFGAVQPYVYMFLGVAGITAGALFVIHELLTRRTISLIALGWLAAMAIAQALEPKLVLPVFAAGWCWLIVRRSPLKGITLLNLILVLGATESMLGLLQHFIMPGWIFGYQNEYPGATGTLINRNHYAGLLEMIIPAAIAGAYIAWHRQQDAFRMYFYLLIGGFLSIGLIFSVSRVGIFAGFVSLMGLASLIRLKHASKGVTIFVVSFILVVTAAAIWIGTDVVTARYAALSEPDSLIQDGRVMVFTDTLRLLKDHPLGVGPSNYRDVFRQYQSWRPEYLFDHAHNDYLEAAAEWGVVPAALGWGAVFYLLVRGVRRFLETQSVERAGVLLACIGAISSIAIHSLTDFNLQIPSNAMLFFALAGVLAVANSKSLFPMLRPAEHRSRKPRDARRLA